MKRIFTLIVFSILGIAVSFSQTWNWAKSFANDHNNSMTFDYLSPIGYSNHVTAAGMFYGEFISGNDTLKSTGWSGSVYVSRLNDEGDFIWLKSISSIQDITLSIFKTDNNGNSYVGGFYGGLELKSEDTLIYNQGKSDGFIAKFDSEGHFNWMRNFGSPEMDQLSDIDIDDLGNIYIMGRIFNVDTTTLFIIKADSLGIQQNIMNLKYLNYTFFPQKIKCQSNNEIIVSGTISGTVVINDSLMVQNNSANDFIVLHLNNQLENINSTSLLRIDDYEEVSNVIMKDNYLYKISTVYTSIDTIVYNSVQYVNLDKLDYNLNSKWKYTINNGAINSYSIEDMIYDFPGNAILDKEDNFVLMLSSGSTRFVFNNDTTLYSTNYESDIFPYFENYILVLDSNGNDKLFYNFNGDLMSGGISITLLPDGNILTSGTYQDSIYNIGQFQLFNPFELEYYSFIHGHYYYYGRPYYNYLASFSLSPTTGLIQRQNNSLPSKLYPNPSNNIIKIKFEQALSSNAELIVFSIDGKLITKQNYPSGTSEIQLDVSSYPKGVYLAGVQSGEERVVHKFLKN